MKFLLVFIFFISILFAEDFNKNSDVKDFINYISKKHNFSKKLLEKEFSNVEVQKESLNYYRGEKKSDYKKYDWDKYSSKYLSDKKVSDGVEFLEKYNDALYKAFKRYKIPSSYIVAIIGIESNYGSYMGKWSVFDTLATLAFKENRRNDFFKKELEEYLLITKLDKVAIREFKGSWAGAMGYCQFMPSNIKKIGVDFDNNGDIRVDKAVDAIGSVANYLYLSGWKKGVPVATRVKYKGSRFEKFETGYKTSYKRKELKGISPYKKFYYNGEVSLIKLNKEKYDELWFGTSNFKVITTYNRSSYYAMSVHQLAQKIKKAYRKKYQ